MRSGCARGYDNSVEAVLLYGFLYLGHSSLRTSVNVIFTVSNVWESPCILNDFWNVHNSAYVYAALTDEHSNPWFFFSHRLHSLQDLSHSSSATLAAVALPCIIESGISPVFGPKQKPQAKIPGTVVSTGLVRMFDALKNPYLSTSAPRTLASSLASARGRRAGQSTTSSNVVFSILPATVSSYHIIRFFVTGSSMISPGLLRMNRTPYSLLARFTNSWKPFPNALRSM